jgi:class 3 adenylate cyclase
MTEVVKRHNGMVNQFVGDEVFAVFGAPIAYPNNEENAVFCALEMVETQRKLNEAYREEGLAELAIGIGINAGEVVAGNMGCEDKIEYSVTGDTVNTGKRIEMLTQEFPNKILISERVCQKVSQLVEVIPWEPVNVKGKKDKITVFEVTGRK